MKPIYLELESTAQAVALSVTTVQRLVREGGFPRPRELSGRRVAWLVRELEDWAESRPVSDIAPPANTSGRSRKSDATPAAAQS